MYPHVYQTLWLRVFMFIIMCNITKLKKQHFFYETFCYVLIVYIYVILIGHLIHALHNLGQPGSEGTIVYHTKQKYIIQICK